MDAELETICLKCLEKDPGRRYSSAAELAADLEKWLCHEPIMARPATAWERFAKWTRRNPRLAAMAGLLVVVGLAGLAGVLTQWRRAFAGEREARRQLYAANVNLAHQAWEEGSLRRARELLVRTRPRPGDPEDLRGYEWRYLWRLSHQDGSRHTITNVPGGVTAAMFWSNDRLLLAGTNEVRLTDLRGETIDTLLAERDGIQRILRSPAATNLLAVATRQNELKLWDLARGDWLATFTNHTAAILALAFSPDGRRLVPGSWDQTVRLWNLDPMEHRVLTVLRGHERELTSVAFAPDGQTLIATDAGAAATVWDLKSALSAGLLGRHPSWMDALAFSPDGTRLASVGYVDPIVKVWDVESRRELATFAGHPEPIHRVRFTPAGRLVATCGHEGTVRLWQIGQAQPVDILTNEFPISILDISPDGRLLAAGGGPVFGHRGVSEGLCLGDLPRRQRAHPVERNPDKVSEVAFDPLGRYLAAGLPDGTVWVWDPATGWFLHSWPAHTRAVFCLAFSRDGQWLASGSLDATIALYDLSDLARPWRRLLGHTDWLYSLAFSPEGRTLASTALDGAPKLWSLATREVALTLRNPGSPVICLAFAPDGNLLATGSADGSIRLWPAAASTDTDTTDSDAGSPSR